MERIVNGRQIKAIAQRTSQTLSKLISNLLDVLHHATIPESISECLLSVLIDHAELLKGFSLEYGLIRVEMMIPAIKPIKAPASIRLLRPYKTGC